MNTFHEFYRDNIVPSLMDQLKLSSPMEVPRLIKITINMDNSPKVSIIIPHYNNYNIIKDCLESIGNLTFENFETIVVDNASSDDSAQLLKNNHCDINLIQSEYNRGYAGGCNYGAEFAKGEYLLFLNNDTEHENNFIEPNFVFLNNSIKKISIFLKNKL